MRIGFTRRRLLVAVCLSLCLVLLGLELFLLSADVRTLALVAAEWLGADEFVIARLDDRDLQVRNSAGEVLKRRGEKAVSALILALDDPEPENRRAVAAALASIGARAKEAIPALVHSATEDEDEGVQETAGKALGIVARDHPEKVDEILILLDSPTDSEKLAAIRAAAWLNDRRALSPLVVALKHTNPKVREEAAEALGDLRVLAIPALPALIEVVGDPVPAVRSEAGEAIAKILKVKPGLIDPHVMTAAKEALERAWRGGPAQEPKAVP
jgi:HEAT repeat protein